MSDAPQFDPSFRHRLDALFRWRRDVRRFEPDPVPAQTLAALFAVADLAPSVGLSQPWRFVTVDNPVRRQAVRDNFLLCNADAAREAGSRAAAYAALKLAGLDVAPVHFALYADPAPQQGHGLGRKTMPDTTAYSAVMALHTMWLAARTRGLGLGWVSILDPAAIGRILDVPEHWQLIGYFCLGVPSHENETPELERLGWERRHAGEVLRR